MSKTKSIVTILLVATMLASMTACSGDNATENASTPTTTTTVPEVTTEEPTTEEPTTEYVYKGIKMCIGNRAVAYFDGLILESGDKIYLNDIYTGQSWDDDCERGAEAYAILVSFNMREEEDALREKYWSEATWTPEIPYSDNYFIKYTGEKVEFVFVENTDTTSIFDVIPVK